LTALASSPFAGEPYLFIGFLPPSRGKRQKALAGLKDVPWNLVFYESPLRVHGCLQDLHQILGDRVVFLGRELTKHFEETLEAAVSEISSRISARELKGEITMIVKGATREEATPEDLPLAVEKAKALIVSQDLSKKEAARRIAAEYGFSAREIYRQLIGSYLITGHPI
jgi:16S rRNA (cytidine1402-2'-O)-methyltransferase